MNENEAQEAIEDEILDQEEEPKEQPIIKRGRGRPKGSKNKPKMAS